MLGPYRVLPGRLSVTRTFGDIEAKFVRYGGNPRVVVAVPEIKSFKIDHKHDFIILGCNLEKFHLNIYFYLFLEMN